MDWKWIIPKLLFVVPVLFATIWIVYEKICESLSPRRRKKRNYSAITFALIVIWLSSEAIDILVRRLQEHRRSSSIEAQIGTISTKINEAMNSRQAHVLVNRGDTVLFPDVKQDIFNSSVEIDIISAPSFGDQHRFEERAQTMIEAFLARAQDKSRRIIMRRLFWRPEQLDFLQHHREQYDKLDGVLFAYLSPNSVDLPITPCVIIDNKIVHFGLGYLGNPSTDEVDISITDAEVAKVYHDYFERLWARSRTLKDRFDPVNVEAVQEIRANLPGQGTDLNKMMTGHGAMH